MWIVMWAMPANKKDTIFRYFAYFYENMGTCTYLWRHNYPKSLVVNKHETGQTMTITET